MVKGHEQELEDKSKKYYYHALKGWTQDSTSVRETIYCVTADTTEETRPGIWFIPRTKGSHLLNKNTLLSNLDVKETYSTTNVKEFLLDLSYKKC